MNSIINTIKNLTFLLYYGIIFKTVMERVVLETSAKRADDGESSATGLV